MVDDDRRARARDTRVSTSMTLVALGGLALVAGAAMVAAAFAVMVAGCILLVVGLLLGMTE